MGAGDTLMQITSYSLITNTFQEDVLKYITYIEISIGIGLSIGPFIGSLVYSSLNFEGTLYMFAAISGFGALLCQVMLPGQLNSTLTKSERDAIKLQVEKDYDEIKGQNESHKTNNKKLTWCKLLLNFRMFLLLMVSFVGTFNVNYWTGGFLTDYMTS